MKKSSIVIYCITLVAVFIGIISTIIYMVVESDLTFNLDIKSKLDNASNTISSIFDDTFSNTYEYDVEEFVFEEISEETDENNVFKNQCNLNDLLWKNKEEEELNYYPYENEEGLFGYINENGKVVIEAEYEGAEYFSEGLAAVYDGYGYGYIDKNGEEVIECYYDYVGEFTNGLAVVYMDDMSNVINRDGEEILDFYCDYVQIEQSGLIYVEDGNDIYYTDEYGNEIIEDGSICRIDGFYNGFAQVLDSGYNTTIINKDFNQCEFNGYKVEAFYYGVVSLVDDNDNEVYINSDMYQVALKEQYSSLNWFTEGDEIACVAMKNSNEYQYINYSGEKLFTSDYYLVSPFEDGLAVAMRYDDKNDMYDYVVINNKGELIIEGYEEINIVSSDVFIVTENNIFDDEDYKYSVIDSEGNTIINAEYESIYSCGNLIICTRDDDDNYFLCYDLYDLNGKAISKGVVEDYYQIDSKMVVLYEEDDCYYYNIDNNKKIEYSLYRG